ncbi:MAG: STAS domain-containing protein [Myxococcota bacterium]
MADTKNLSQRLEAIEDILAAASTGKFDIALPVNLSEDADSVTAVEYGINLMLEDLAQIQQRDAKRNQDLEEMLELSQQQARQLEESIELVRSQQRSISELSTPVLELWDNVLAMPIIGVVDTQRSIEIMEKLLQTVAEKQTKFVILDVTAVEVVDTKTADHFIKVVQATQLLGATCLISGIKPAVAQTLVDIGVDLASITTVANLRQGLRECLRRLGSYNTN